MTCSTAARTFMGNVTHEHHVMAGELTETLDKFHGDLSDRVEDMRKRHRASLKQTQAELRQRLDENKAARKSPSRHAEHVSRSAAGSRRRPPSGQQCLARIHRHPPGR